MPGSFDLSPVPAGQAIQAMPIIVALYRPGNENPYTVIPNVRCLRIDYREGAQPSAARFQYIMDDLLQIVASWPAQFEQLWPIDAQGNYVVRNDDRLVVLTQIPPATADSSPQTIVLFDGFAQVPQTDVSAQHQSVTFAAQGVAIRLWDRPLSLRLDRDTSQTGKVDGSADILTRRPTRFNPASNSIGSQGGYMGNAVPSALETITGPGVQYPVFLDPLVVQRGPTEIAYWTVWGALAYLITVAPFPLDATGNPYVILPTIGSLQAIFSTPGGGGIFGAVPDIVHDMQIRDYDATNKAVPEIFAELCRYCGIVAVFATGQDADGNPATTLVFQRRDEFATVAPKLLYLADDGATSLNLAANNTTAMHLARDSNEIVNRWTVETGPRQVEISVTLAPGFTPVAGDDSPTNLPKWFKSNLTNATDDSRRKYRWYVADECADGHYNQQTSTFVSDQALDLSTVFPPDPDTGNVDYIPRYRPGSHQLIAKDSSGKPLKAVLQIYPNTKSGDPRLLQNTDTPPVLTINGDWTLLDDRLGIEVTAADPNTWHTEMIKTAGQTIIPTIRGVTAQCNPGADLMTQPFKLVLTTVIEADHNIPVSRVTAAKRMASPTRFTRTRTADGRDHFQYCTIDPGSINYPTQKDIKGNPGDNTNPLVMRDDTTAAKTHAEQLRAAHEFPTLAGSATLPFITDYYVIGDRVKIVQGRNASLQINVGADQGEAPSYPWVTAFAWDFQGDKQHTILQFSDRRGEPQGV